MIRRAATALAVVLVGGMGLVPSGAEADVKPGGLMSSNVDWVAHLPIDSPGVGGRVVQVGDQTRFYVTGAKGLTIYDVTNPTVPVPLGTVAVPHFQNEDVSVSDDGSRVIISGEYWTNPGTLPGLGPTVVIDASIPQLPRIAQVIGIGSHTVSCVDSACDWVYSSEGDIYDLRNLASPRLLRGAAGWQRKAEAQIGTTLRQTAHDLNRDAVGIVTTDTMPRLMLDVSNPEQPVVLARSAASVGGGVAYQHNNLRPGAGSWVPRADSTPYQPGETLRAGEILYANGETNFQPFCNGSTNGPFSTWSVKNWDKGATIVNIDVYRPVSGMYTNGNPAVNVMGCSGHWFTERGGVVAAGWYEHGTRFLDVDDTGQISEIGFFQPVVGAASGAYWVSDEIVYVVDYARGIDILRFNRGAPTPSAEEIAESWLAKVDAAPVPAAAAERFACNLAVTGA